MTTTGSFERMGEVKEYPMSPFELRSRTHARSARTLALLLAAIATSAYSEPPAKTAPGWTLGAFAGHGYTILSSEVNRDAIGLNIGYGKPEPHFRIGKLPAQLVFEGYTFNTRSDGINESKPFAETVFGAMSYARWRWPRKHGIGAYLDFGIGLCYADRSNRDLDSRVDSTPYLGGGFALPSGKGEWLVGAAWLHVSNAGTKGHNQGMNFLMIGARHRF